MTVMFAWEKEQVGKVGIKNSVFDVLKQKCPSDIPGERLRREQDVWIWSSEISCLGKVTLWMGFKGTGRKSLLRE